MNDQPQHGVHAQTETGGMRHIARTRTVRNGMLIRRRDERTLCGRAVYAWSMPGYDDRLPLCSRCGKRQAAYLHDLGNRRYQVAQGAATLGGWVIWDDITSEYLRDNADRMLRFPSRHEAVVKVSALMGLHPPFARQCGATIRIGQHELVPCRAPFDEQGECVVSTLHARR